jgi:O-acetyl-ADP-ribose deacetylase (regulator of RNase III)
VIDVISVSRGYVFQSKSSDYICCVSNASGLMSSSIAKQIRLYGGREIEDEAMLVCSKVIYSAGDVYVTGAGKLPYNKILHLSLTKYPNDSSSYDFVEKCLRNLIAYCKMMSIKQISIPSMGIGVGGLDIVSISKIYKDILSDSDIHFFIVDNDPIFIYQFMEYM